MRVIEIKMIKRPVDVSRHKDNRVETVLLPIRLSQHHAHRLGQGIRRAARKRHAVEQFSFMNRIRRLVGITARAHQRDKFFHARAPAFVQHHRAHDQIFITEIRRRFFIGQRAADAASQMKNQIRPVLLKHAADFSLRGQVVITARWRH